MMGLLVGCRRAGRGMVLAVKMSPLALGWFLNTWSWRRAKANQDGLQDESQDGGQHGGTSCMPVGSGCASHGSDLYSPVGRILRTKV